MIFELSNKTGQNKDSCHVNFVMSKIVFKKSTDNTTPPCTYWVCVIRM